MTFHIGQKVVCVVAAEGSCECRREPDKGNVCTVSNVYMHCMGLVLELEEFPAAKCVHFDPGWLAESFRPLVERKTDISVFTEMLTKSGVDA